MKMVHAPARALALSCVALFLCARAAQAQAPPDPAPATRAEALHAEREAKSQATEPHHQNSVEKAFDVFEDRAIFLLDREGFYPKLGSADGGSGFAYGLGFRDRDLFNNYGALDMWVAGELRGYFAAEGRIRFPELAHKRLLLESLGRAARLCAGELFGLGPGSDRDAQSDYALRTTIFGGVRASGRSGACSSAATSST